MTDWPPTRAEDERILSAFRRRMGRRYANGRNTEPGPGAQKALSPCGRRRLVLEPEVAEDILRLLTRGTNDLAMYITPAELSAAMLGAELVPGAVTGLGPRGITRRFDLTFGPMRLTGMLCMGVACKPTAVEAAA